MMKRRSIKILIGAAIGASLGFAYYALVGCSSGGCPITSSPYISTAYGAIAGVLVAGV
jgi:hypothetical protein